MSSIILAFMAGVAVGVLIGLLVGLRRSSSRRALAEEAVRRSEEARRGEIDRVLEGVKATFSQLSFEALGRANQELLKLAKAQREVDALELESKKGLIDQRLQAISAELEKASVLMQELEKDRVEKFGQLTTQLQATGELTTNLARSTEKLREALSGSKARGQWGERMAEDILRTAGFVEGVNYLKQKSIEGVGSRPDFTFQLPRGLTLNMDVKFPLDNYQRYLESEEGREKEDYKSAFIRDVKARIKEVTTREYVNPEQNTIDCVLLFIPNEQIFAFIHEVDASIIDLGLNNKVVFCSPVTLFAVLAVIRQSIDNFAIEQTSGEILGLLGKFHKQWNEFVEKMEKMGKKIDEARKEYEALVTTRRRQLEKPLEKLEELRARRGLTDPTDDALEATPGD